MKARIADVTHPWPLVAGTTPDLGGQRLIGIYAMRHEVAEGAARVHDLLAQLAAAPAVAAALGPARLAVSPGSVAAGPSGPAAARQGLRATPTSISMLPAGGGSSTGTSGRQ